MEKITQKDIDWLLNLDKTSAKNPAPAAKKKKRYVLRISVALFVLFGLVLLPFFLLIRTSVFLNLHAEWNAWFSLGGGIMATVMLLVVYILFFFRK